MLLHSGSNPHLPQLVSQSLERFQWSHLLGYSPERISPPCLQKEFHCALSFTTNCPFLFEYSRAFLCKLNYFAVWPIFLKSEQKFYEYFFISGDVSKGNYINLLPLNHYNCFLGYFGNPFFSNQELSKYMHKLSSIVSYQLSN